jgi:hypothetical protein
MHLRVMFAMASLYTGAFETNNAKWKKEIEEECERSKQYPRKKKKAVRKRLKLEKEITDFNPFEGTSLDFKTWM